MKKVFIISTSLLLVAMFFFGIYNLAFNKKQKTDLAVVQNDSQDKEKLQNADEKKVVLISDQSILGLFINKKAEKIVYYSASDGTVWESDFNGSNKIKTENFEITGLQNVFWSIDGKNSISEFTKENRHFFYRFNHSSNIGAELDKGIDYISWDETGAKIIYKYFNEKTKKGSLEISNPDGTNWLVLAEIPYFKGFIKQIPHTSLVSFWNDPNSKDESILKIVSVLGGEVKTLFSGKFGVDYRWSPNGEVAVVSSLNEKGGNKISLGLLKIKDGSYQSLDIPTFAEKTVWSSDNKTLYYTLPLSIPEGSILPDDYQSKKIKTNDTFWKVDTVTGKKERIISAENIKETYDASNLMLSPTEDILFFINKIDGKLYKVSL
jgi:hypothetical protein